MVPCHHGKISVSELAPFFRPHLCGEFSLELEGSRLCTLSILLPKLAFL